MLFNKKPLEQFPHQAPAAVDIDVLGPGPVEIVSRKPSGRSVIDACLKITGNLHSDRDVQVDGYVDGDIHCTQLIVGKDATVNGHILAEEVVVRGRVTGSIRANRAILQATAHVESEIFHTSLAVEEGACFNGQSRRVDQPARAEVEVGLHQAQMVAAE